MAISRALRYQVLRRDNHTCQSCGGTAPDTKLEVDHVIPEALGGQTVPENLRALCADCNGGKSAAPPDAAQVAAVNADALRWAEAQKTAAATMLADVKARNAIYRKFNKAWLAWADIERPPTWKQSIDSFIAAGLPIEVLLDCVDRAMANQKIRPRDVFRYMCGIAWARVTDMQTAASDVVREGKGERSFPDPVQVVLSNVSDRDLALWLTSGPPTLHRLLNCDPYPGSDDTVNAAALGPAAIRAAIWLAGVLNDTEAEVSRLWDSLPLEAQERCKQRLFTERPHESAGEQATNWHVNRWAIRIIADEVMESWPESVLDEPVLAEAGSG